MRRFLVLVMLALTLAGCGGGGGKAAWTPTADKNGIVRDRWGRVISVPVPYPPGFDWRKEGWPPPPPYNDGTQNKQTGGL